MVTPTITLDAQQIADYHATGWLSVRSISTPAELALLRETYDSLFAARAGREDGRQYDLVGNDRDPERAAVPQIIGLTVFRPELRETIAWANARQIFTQLLGAEPETLGDHAILKPPFSPMPTPWHQDEAYWDAGREYRMLSLWIPLQDVDLDSGCMHFVPGSHRLDVLPHRPIGGDPEVHGLELVGDPTEITAGAVHVPLAAGGCTAHHQRMLHYTTPNRKAEPRRAWIIMGNLPSQPRVVPRRFPWKEAQHTQREQRARAAVAAAAAAAATKAG